MTDQQVQLSSRSLSEQLDQARADVRARPDDVEARHRLWQWMAIHGDWQRAWEQSGITLKLLGDAPSSIALHREAIQAEMTRQDVFSGARPMTLAPDAPAWLHVMADAMSRGAAGDTARAQSLRAQALDAAAPSAGHVQGEQDSVAFEWLCDGDSRLGPVCELFVGGHYRWLPFEAVASWRQARPGGLTELLWSTTVLSLRDGSSLTALMPVRYPSMNKREIERDDAVRFGRRTTWHDLGDDQYFGIGQRMMLSDTAEHAMLDMRHVSFDGAESVAAHA